MGFLVLWASLVVQLVKNPPAMWETHVGSLGWVDPLEKGTVTHSVFQPGEFQEQRRMASYSPGGCKELDTTERLHLGYYKSSTHVFNTLNFNFRPQTYYGLPYSYLPKEMWSPQGKFGPQIQF